MGFSFKSIFKAAVVAAAVATGVGFLATAGYLGAGLAASVAAAGGIAAYATGAAIMGALTAGVSMLLAETPKSFDLGEQIRGQLTTARAPAADARIVYGETRLGGNIVFIETTGSKNETMFQAMTLAGHEIQSIETVYANDEALTLNLVGNAYTTTYKGNATALSFNWLLGTDTQSPLAFFTGTTAATYPFKGIAVLGAKLVYNQDVFPQGIPNITVKLRGKKVYDPRTTTTAYSTNAALCIRDYLTDTTFGLGATTAEIDDASFISAADICDENVNLAAGGTEKRYTINGAFSSAEKPKDVIAKMLTACGGKLAYVGGKWTLRVAAYRSPTVTLTEDDIVGPVTMQASQSRRDIFNAVKGTYSEPGTLYQPASFPPVTNATYESQDGERIWKDVQFPFTTSAATCQRLAKIDLETARQQISFTMSCKLTAFALQPGDTVNVNFERYGWTNKVFEVYNWTFNIADSDSGPTPQVDLVLRETASGIYDWNTGNETQIDLAPNTTLPDPFDVTAPGITITDELAVISEEVLTKLVVTVAGDSTFQDFYEVQARKVGDPNYTNLGQASGNRFELPNVEDGTTYEVRARSVNGLGVRSAFTTGSHQVVGKTTPPADVTNFSMNIIGSEAHFTWTPVADLDLSHYKIRHSRLTTGATYAESVDLILRIARPGVTAVAPAMTGTYFIKAIDKLGNASVNAAEIVAIIEDIKGLNAVETVTESPTFAGNKTECHVVDGTLVLDTAIDFDDISGLFDDAEGDFDGGGGTVSTTGTYEFAQVVDLGAVYTSRVTAFVEVGRLDYVNTFDSAPGLFDSREGDFDGSPNAFDDTNVEVQVSVTNDNPNQDPTYNLTTTSSFAVGSVASASVSRTENAVFSCVATLPSSPTNSCLFEMGASLVGCFVGFSQSGTLFRVRAGDGATLSESSTICAMLNIPVTEPYFDDQFHQLTWDFRINPGRVRLWIDGILVGEASTTAGGPLETNSWAGSDNGGFGIGFSTASPESSAPYVGLISGSLNYYRNQLVSYVQPTFSEYRKFFVGDYKARGLRFRAILTSRDAQASPSISSLEVEVDMPDRVTSGDDITSGTDAGGKVVNFAPAFKAAPAIGIAAQNLVSGDYYEIVSKTASGFTIRFKNSGGTVVDRTFDYVARGYGELAA